MLYITLYLICLVLLGLAGLGLFAFIRWVLLRAIG